MLTDRKKIAILLILLLLSVSALVFAPMLGMRTISLDIILARDVSCVEYNIYRNIRLPRIALAFMVGAILSLCGMVYQAIFRNPLTTPFTLGISSGAAFGAIAFIVFGGTGAFMIAKGYTAAFSGAILSMTLVYLTARFKGGFSTLTMLLAGVAINFFFSSLILLLQYVADLAQVFQTYRWLMGSLDAFGFDKVLSIAPFFVLGSIAILLSSNELNLMLLGEDVAISRGLDVAAFKMIMFVVCSLMVGAVVSLCGVIGFVGIVSPHICRLLIGNDHKYLGKAAFLFGGFFLVVCDAASRMIIPPSEFPVGIITALLGGPFFLWLLITKNVRT